MASVNRLEAVEKQRQALDYRKQGATYERIALKLGYSHPSGAYQAVRSALQKTLQEPADELRRLELERLDMLWNSLGPGISQGKPRAIEVALKVMDRRAQLLGLDAPTKIHVSMQSLAEQIATERGLEPAAVLAEAESILKGAG